MPATRSKDPGSAQTRRDHGRVDDLVAQHPRAFVESMNHRLKDYQKEQLLMFVGEIARSRAIKYSRRLCERGRDAITAFFCEHAPGFPVGFAPPIQGKARAAQANKFADDEYQFATDWTNPLGDMFADPFGCTDW
jgi:hypothetical protein